MPAPIELIPVSKSIIDLSALPKNSFNSVLYGYNLKQLLDDVILVQYTDQTPDGSTILRRGIHIPVNADTKAWRIGKVILAGPNCKLVKQHDYVIFPNNLGIPISNLDVEGFGTLETGLFLNEQRIFGIASIPKDNNESVSSIIEDNPTK